MLEEKKKHIEDLYSLVKSMSRADRIAFSSDILGSQHNYVALFNALAKSRNFNRKGLIPKISPTEKALYDSSRYLAQKILEWLSVKEHSCRWELTMIKKAVRQGFYSIGLGVLKKQFSIAWDQKDLFYLRDLYELKNKVYNHHGLSIEIEKGIASEDTLLSELSTILKAEVLRKEIKREIQRPFPERVRIAEKYRLDIERLSPDGLEPRSRVKVHKAIAVWYRILNEFKEARIQHDIIQNIMQDHFEDFDLEDHVDEYTLGVFFLVNEGLFSEAEKLVFQIGMLEAQTPSQAKKITSGWVYCALLISAGGAKEDIGKRAIHEFEKLCDSLPSHRRINMLHWGSIVHFYSGNWNEVISFQNRISRYGKAVSSTLKAVSNLVRAIAKFEKGLFEESILDIEKFAKISEGKDLKYPSIVSSVMSSVIQAGGEFPPNDLLVRNLLGQIEILSKDELEQPLIWLFDISAWLISKMTGQNISNIVNTQDAPGLIQMKFVS